MRCGAVERVMERGRSATCAGVLPAGRDVLHHMLDRKLERVCDVRTRVGSAKTKNSYVCTYVYIQYRNTRI